MTERWSYAANDVIDFDEFDYVTDCDECGIKFDLADGGCVEDDDAFCEPCYNNIFGG